MEVERRKLGRVPAPTEQPRTGEELRAKQIRAREMLRGDITDEELEQYVERSLFATTLEKGLNWARANSIFPATFGLACCAIEMMSMVTARYDIARFGAEALRASPRQADLLILSGRVSIKMAPVVRRMYDQMLEPKWVIAMGACSSSGGMFHNYAVVQGAGTRPSLRRSISNRAPPAPRRTRARRRAARRTPAPRRGRRSSRPPA